MDINSIDPTDTLMLGAGPLIRKIVQKIIEKYPSLFEWATPISIGTAFVFVVGIDLMPDMVELYLKSAVALAGVTSVYNDYRMSKVAETEKNLAIADTTTVSGTTTDSPEQQQ